MVRSQACQRVGEEGLHRGGASVEADETARRLQLRAKLHLEEDTVPPSAFECLPQQKLVVASAVEVSGIKQRDPSFDCFMNGGNALTIIRGSVGTGHGHAAETDN